MREKSYMFGDNQSVVNSAMDPTSRLHKRHTVLSFHRVREAMATGKYVFTHISGENNPADILSKHWGAANVWHMLRLLFYHEGDTICAPGKENQMDIDGDTTFLSSISARSNHKNQDSGGRVLGNVSTHSVESSRDLRSEQVTYEGKKLQVYRCSSKLGSISFSEDIPGSYGVPVRTNVHSYIHSEYFDSDGSTTEIGQTVSTNKIVSQTYDYPSNESLGRSMTLQDLQGRPRIRIENSDKAGDKKHRKLSS